MKCFIADAAKLREATDDPIYHLRGEKLTVKEMSPATDIQVICSNQKPGEVIDKDTIESFFSHPRYTGVKDPSAMQGVMQLSTYDNRPVFAVTYSNPERMYNLCHSGCGGYLCELIISGMKIMEHVKNISEIDLLSSSC